MVNRQTWSLLFGRTLDAAQPSGVQRVEYALLPLASNFFFLSQLLLVGLMLVVVEGVLVVW